MRCAPVCVPPSPFRLPFQFSSSSSSDDADDGRDGPSVCRPCHTSRRPCHTRRRLTLSSGRSTRLGSKSDHQGCFDDREEMPPRTGPWPNDGHVCGLTLLPTPCCRYTVIIEKVLAQGGFATVYLSKDASGKAYALKKVRGRECVRARQIHRCCWMSTAGLTPGDSCRTVFLFTAHADPCPRRRE